MSNFRDRNDIARLKKSIDPIQFYHEEGQEVNTSGRNNWRLAGICPFHEDQEAGSFFIHSETGAYKCFSCGITGGDIISFLMQKHGLSFKETLHRLQRLGGER